MMDFKKTALAGALALAFGSTAAANIHVDQVGYLTGHDKIAMVSDTAEQTFRLVDAKTGATVYEGTLSAEKYDVNSNDKVRTADFTSFEQAGRYRLAVGSGESCDFSIGDNVYAVPTVQNLRSYTLSRANNPFKDDITGLEVKKGHPQTAHAEVYFTDKQNKKGDKVDVSGGWYDAGDYGKYITTAAITSAELLLAYESHPDHFTKGQLFFPKGIKGEADMPDLLSEVKYEVDWMRKMQRKDGSTFHKVAGAQWPGFDKSPDTDDQPFFIYSTASSSTAMYGASLAVAARVYQAYNTTYAAALKKDAERVWNFLAKTPTPFYRVDEGQESGSGPYNKDKDAEERIWLAAEMFKTTGDKTYENYLKENEALLTTKPGFFTWDNTLALGQYAYATSENADPALKEKTQRAFLSYADDVVEKINHDGYRCALAKEEYTWASTKNALTMGDMLLMANRISAKKEYVEGALDQIHYLFGRNALNKSFMTGVGANPPEHPHNRIHESTGAYVPGLVVGGPNYVSGGDPDQTKYLKSGDVPPAKAYLDVLTSWSTNEYAIDYTAAAAYALAWFTKAEPEMTSEWLKLSREFPPVSK